MSQPVVFSSGLVELGFESTWGRVLAFFSFCIFFAYTKIRTIFFCFSDLVICGFLVWSDSVRTAAAVAIMYRFTAAVAIMYRFTSVPHVLLYSSTINNVLFTAVGRQTSRFEPSLRCFLLPPPRFFSFFFGGWLIGLMDA